MGDQNMASCDTEPSPAGTKGGGIRLLRGNRPFLALFSSRTVSFTGESVSLVTLMLFVADSTGQAIAVSVLLLVGDFVPALLGPVTGAVSDRFDLRRVMVGCELVQGAALLAIALVLPPLWLLLLLVALRATAGQVFLPASRAAVPALVADRDLESANSTVGFGTNGAEALGPLLAAALFPFLGIQGVLMGAAASYLFSALVLLAMPSLPSARDAQVRTSLLAEAREGLGYIWRTKPVRVIAAGFCAVVAFNGVDDVALVLLATETLDAGESAVGLLLAGVGIGLVAAYALLARFGTRNSMVVLLVAGFAVSSLGNLLTGLAWAVAAAFTLQLVRGLGIAAMDVATNTLLQRIVPAGMVGRVFGNLYGAVGVAAGLSYLAGGLLLDATDARTTFIAAGTGGLVTTLLVALTLPRAWRRRDRTAPGSSDPDHDNQEP
ncbi:MFS family permease [Lipingzhangella halophila]|uniref:MFS family permease n=1 Tax=Lipingzhangella halophila TaxID=1783352 RepID=A0A7W7RHR7_9ACTN|nr:MFS transporter [Lipingzhangella halophila]MBB4932226.1 MFS family permease [Lipingzhangella halophila]